MMEKYDLSFTDLVWNSVMATLGVDRPFTHDQEREACIQSVAEVEAYCNRKFEPEYAPIVAQIALAKLNKIGAEGINSTNMSGVSESYIDGWPESAKAVFRSKRKARLF